MLYHKQLGLPQVAASLFGRSFRLNYGHHAKHACLNDRYGLISAPPFVVTVNEFNLIELECDKNIITKFVIRLPYDAKFDVVLAIQPDGFVRTIWKNEKSDLHFTLDKSKYSILNENLN